MGELQADRVGMLVATGFTNLAYIPVLFLAYRRKALFHLYVGSFTLLCSSLYHCQEALSFRLYLSASGWHRLDNVGSIVSWLAVLINCMDNLDWNDRGYYVSPVVAKVDYHLLYASFLSVLLAQTKDPWGKLHSFLPIALITVIFLLKVVFVRFPRVDWTYFRLSIPWLCGAAYFFVRGLDNNTDYLRGNHGMWHVCAGVSIFYLWQSIDKTKAIPGVNIGKFEKTEKLGLISCLIHLISFGYIPATRVKPCI